VLVLSRRVGETVILGENLKAVVVEDHNGVVRTVEVSEIKVTVLDLTMGQAKLGFTVPSAINVDREERRGARADILRRREGTGVVEATS